MAELEKIASQIRRDIIRMVHGAKNGHPGGALGCADLLTLLYFKHMTHSTDFKMNGKGEDVFFLSNGHISAVQYSALARAGYFPIAELATHRRLNSRLQGHPTPHAHLPGIRIASGSLGQGLSVAVGVATGKKLDKDDKLVYVLMGDGEQQEGQVWEAAMYAAHHNIDNLIAIIDCNGQQIDGSTEEVMSLGELQHKYQAFGWEVIKVEKGNDIPTLDVALIEAKAKAHRRKPVMLLMHTEMGYPIDFMVGTHKWHGVAPNDTQKDLALAQLLETLGDY